MTENIETAEPAQPASRKGYRAPALRKEALLRNIAATDKKISGPVKKDTL